MGYKDCQAWKDNGLHISTTCNNAAKFYDAALTQLMSWKDDPTCGGLMETCSNLYKADPEFALGMSFILTMRCFETFKSIHTDDDMKQSYLHLKRLLESQRKTLTPREVKHVEAALAIAEGRYSMASAIFEDILLEHPFDLHAFRAAFTCYFFLGQFAGFRDSSARILPIWEAKKHPLLGFVYAQYAFGLEETFQFAKAEKMARKGLSLTGNDGFNMHTMAHVFEMESRGKEGLNFMNSTVREWQDTNYICCHNHWHRALMSLELGDFDATVDILHQDILTKATKAAFLNIADCSALLWRLKLLKPELVEEDDWRATYEMCKDHSNSHISIFNDAHYMMAYACHPGGNAEASNLLETFPKQSEDALTDMIKDFKMGENLLKSIVYFRDEEYSKVVEFLNPIRYDLEKIGGSYAQRDVFNLMLIVAALKSPNSKDKKLGQALIKEREAFKGPSEMTSKILAGIS